MIMNKFNFADIVLLEFPFSDTLVKKQRPAVVLKDTNDKDIIVARVTSQIKNSIFDIDIKDWKKAGLMLPSIIRVHKIATLEAAMVKKVIGKLQLNDTKNLKNALADLFCDIV